MIVLCPKCEARNEDEFYYCANCGALLGEETESGGQPLPDKPEGRAGGVRDATPSEQGHLPEKPGNWLVPSIVVTALSFFGCSCLPLGVIGIIFATTVDSKYSAGDYEGSRNAANKAKLFTILAIVVGLLLNVVLMVAWILLAISVG